MGKFIVCPFCGVSGTKTKEHVWAQWLHQTPGAEALLEGTHGERKPSEAKVLQRGADGRYELHEAGVGAVARWLPNVTVLVCGSCNSGWMSRLESEAKRILSPFISGDAKTLRLSADDVTVLATWATKSWMAYALVYPDQSNPFSEADYRAMAASPAPLDRSRIWLMHSREPVAHVSMGLGPTLFTFGAPVHLATRANTAYAFLAVSTVVFFMLLVPEDAPEGIFEFMSAEDMPGLAPPMLDTPAVRRIWQPPRPQYFPLDELPAGFLSALLKFGDTVWNELGLPTVGLTDGEAAEVFKDWMDGADPKDLRAQWRDQPPPAVARDERG